MTICPVCGHENLEGSDSCEQCQHSLTEMSKPQPRTAVEKGLLKDRIEVLAPRPPLTVSGDVPLGVVLQKMVEKSIGCVMVVEGEQLCGIFTEFDALMKVNTKAAALAQQPISTVMTPRPATLDLENKIAFALHKMHVGGYRHLPILSDGKLAGVSSIRDILNYLADRIADEPQ